VEGVLRKALSKRPDERYPSIREFALAFENAARGQSAVEIPAKQPWVKPRPRWNRPTVVLLGVASLVLLVAAVLAHRSSALAPIAPEAATAVVPTVAQSEAVTPPPLLATHPATALPAPTVTAPKQALPSKEVKRTRVAKATAANAISSDQPAPKAQRKPWIFEDL
jgi:hypothetical protein